MTDRAKVIAAAVARYDIDLDDIEAIRALADLKRLGSELESVDTSDVGLDELLRVIDAVVASIDGLLGDGAALDILGPRAKLTELILAMREVFARYRGSTDDLEAKLADLTETVLED